MINILTHYYSLVNVLEVNDGMCVSNYNYGSFSSVITVCILQCVSYSDVQGMIGYGTNLTTVIIITVIIITVIIITVCILQ